MVETEVSLGFIWLGKIPNFINKKYKINTIHTMEYGLKEEGNLVTSMTCMDLEDIILSETGQSKDTYCLAFR